MDELRTFEQRLANRLKELRPLIAEYEQLQQIAERLGFDIDANGSGSSARTPSQAAPTARQPAAKRATANRTRRARKGAGRDSQRRPGGTRATGVERRERVLTLIRERPGITVSEISKEMGVAAPPLYRVVRKLQSDGLVTKEGTSLRLTSGG
jgi:transposase-like protein